MSQLKICPQCGSEYELDQRFCPKDGSTLRAQNGGGDLVGEIVADRYHVLRKLGEGGMGQVYLAEHVKMGRKSAVKVMNPGMVHDADAISRFNREAANASRINHPNVAAVYDFGETPDGLIYLAMEFVEGEPLTKVVERLGALPPPRAADITRQTAEALAAAHDMGIVHRDLKPDNIMLARNRDGSDCVKVVDFGIAKAGDGASQKVTKTGLVIGTPEYMSPEQLAGDRLDGRSDIYSLALVTFNMLTGKLPFPAETVQEAMIMRLTDRPKRLADVRPDVAWPAELQAVMDRALSRDAAGRYANATDFARELVRAVQQMPVTRVAEVGTAVFESVPPTRVAAARPTPSAGPGTEPARADAASAGQAAPRRRSAGALAAVAVGALVAVGAGSWVAMGGRDEIPPATVTADTARPAGGVTDSLPGAGRVAAAGAAAGLGEPRDAGAAADGRRDRAAGAASDARPRAREAATVTPPAGGSSKPSTTPTFDAAATLARIGTMVESSDRGVLRESIARVDDVLPRLRTRSDSAEALYHKATALGALDETIDACAILARLRSQEPPVTITASARTAHAQLCQ